jgi:hypothetical protein
MNLVHLLASPFLGGPEKQALGLARAQASTHRTIFLSFAERGLARPFLHQARSDGFDAIELTTNAPGVQRRSAKSPTTCDACERTCCSPAVTSRTSSVGVQLGGWGYLWLPSLTVGRQRPGKYEPMNGSMPRRWPGWMPLSV